MPIWLNFWLNVVLFSVNVVYYSFLVSRLLHMYGWSKFYYNTANSNIILLHRRRNRRGVGDETPLLCSKEAEDKISIQYSG